MLRKFNNLPILGSAIALLMFSVAVCVGFADQLYRLAVEHQNLGIFIPITLGCTFVWSLAAVLKEASNKYKKRTVIVFGTVVVALVIAGGLLCIQSASVKSVSGSERYHDSMLRLIEDEKRLQEIKTTVEAQSSADKP